MYLFSSVKSSILNEVAKFNAILDTYARQHDIPLVVGVHISDANSPLRRDSTWKETEAELEVRSGRGCSVVKASKDILLRPP